MSITRIQTMFPEKDGIDYNLLQMTPEGEYSMTRRADGKKLLARIAFVVGKTQNKTITDLTGNVGGDTILFGMNFEQVTSIEIQEDNYNALKNNIKVFQLSNVQALHGDSTEVFNWKTDLVYIDPPWGGPDYKSKENLDVFLGNSRIDEYIRKLLMKSWRPNFIFIKLPRNYNFDRLSNLPHIKQEHRFLIRNFFLFCLEVDAWSFFDEA